MSGGNADLMRSNESTASRLPGRERVRAHAHARAIIPVVGYGGERVRTCVRACCVRSYVWCAIAYLLSVDRRPSERASERWAAAGPAVQQRCLRSRNLTNRFRFRRRELASSIMATREVMLDHLRPSEQAGADDTPHPPAYVKANLHGSLGTRSSRKDRHTAKIRP